MVAPAVTRELETLETDDIQGLVVRGYGSFPAATFVLLEVVDAGLARRYLQRISGYVNTAHISPATFALQVAFTAPGLARLGIPKATYESFAREFLEGMDDEVRAESLGDRGDNDPSTWEWGRTSRPSPDAAASTSRRSDSIDVMLMLYAADAPTLQHHLKTELEVATAGAFRVVHTKPTTMLDDEKEHFGWRDGLSMPVIEGVPRERPRKKHQPSWTHAIRPGEFVLGYRNEYDCFSESPIVDRADDPANHLRFTADGKHKDLGRNGTYLVFREMIQDVVGFWDYLERSSREPGHDSVAKAVALGAKMVGRWPSGAPLVTSHERDDRSHAEDNEFLYSADDGRPDLVGLRCPLGAHIRRANPRNVLAIDRDEPDSLVMVRKHQMIRRGRAFGQPISRKLDPREVLAARGKPDLERRGLHFICLVGHISRQFEFVQRAWIHSANFLGLFKDGDPIAAARRPHDHENANDEFTCPATPLRRKYTRMPQFTRLVGGAYFFLPGIRALRFIARQP